MVALAAPRQPDGPNVQLHEGWSRFTSARPRTGATRQKSPGRLRRQRLIGRLRWKGADLKRRAGSLAESSPTL